MEIAKVKTMTPYEAGKILGKNAEWIRSGLRQGRLPFGTAVEGKTGQWNYLIIEKKFIDFIGGSTNEKD